MNNIINHLKQNENIYYPIATLTVGYILYNRYQNWNIKRKTLKPKNYKADKKNNTEYITLRNGYKTFYRIFNKHNFNKMPTLLLVHGFVGSSEYFLPLINEIKKNGRPCIAIDLYGRGGSDCPDFEYSPENMRKQIEEFIIMLNVPTPFDILGYSMGGAVVAEFASQNLHLVRSAVFLCPMGLKPVTSSFIPPLLYLLNSLSKIVAGNYFDCYLGELVVDYVLMKGFRSKKGIANQWDDTSSKRYKDYEKHTLLRNKNEKHTLFRSVCSLVMHFNLWANMQKRLIQLQGEKIPVLCLWGDKDTILPMETNQFQELIPHAKVQIYEGFTHMFPIEFAEKAAVSIQQFWDESLMASIL